MSRFALEFPGGRVGAERFATATEACLWAIANVPAGISWRWIVVS